MTDIPKILPAVTKKQIDFAQLCLEGYTMQQCVKELFGLVPGDEGYQSKRKLLTKWSEDPRTIDMQRKASEKYLDRLEKRALRIQADSMESSNPWVAIQGSRNVLEFCMRLRQLNADTKETVIRVEGMPDLGLPAGEDGADGYDPISADT